MRSDFTLWQLVDSALPTGGFAHSSGLEAAWQHGEVRDRNALIGFLEASVGQLGEAALPFVLAAYDRPEELDDIDKLCHAFTTNHVANRASRAQGRAFLNVVKSVFINNRAEIAIGAARILGQNAFGPNGRPGGTHDISPALQCRDLAGSTMSPGGTAERGGHPLAVSPGLEPIHGRPGVETPGYFRDVPAGTKNGPVMKELGAAAADFGGTNTPTKLEPPFGHFAPVFGASLRQLAIPRETVARMFFFNHVRGVLAAAVRLNIVGPMEAQTLQSSMAPEAEEVMSRCIALRLDDIAQSAPLLDIWQGAQERLYSRLFQS